ncbi:hypothetical protein TGAM01_v203880 [Trichoderma gamsii]|uniref:Uncharacterized protein n=1 Tax=Trichoderma gamsii TaxID=398673 RepID=A0A2P4ZT89_9HYPO|nr:hypothetical protein TGAM01_v203880 [Trichoderma gamsii]PON27499.1 hypothetical protein TGAM01_v203880 [Trichoderma gamsii]
MRYIILFSAFVATALAGDWDTSEAEKTTEASWPEKTTSAEWRDKTTSAEWAEKTTSAEWPDKTSAEWPTKTEATHEQITPTWESHPHPPPPKVDCKHVKECTDEVDKCRTKPEANQAECSSEYAECLGFNPLNPEADEALKQCEEEGHKPGHNETRPKPPPVIVSGASSMAPLGLISLLAAAAAALL